MKCEKDKGLITDYVSRQMTEDDRSDFESHLRQCATCQNELEEQQRLWDMLGDSPVPATSSRLDELDRYYIQPAESRGLWLKIAAAFILVIAGFAAGFMVNRPVIATSPRYAANDHAVTARKSFRI